MFELVKDPFMRSLKTGQYKRAPPLPEQIINTLFSSGLSTSFFNLRTIMKLGGGKVIYRIMETIM